VKDQDWSIDPVGQTNAPAMTNQSLEGTPPIIAHDALASGRIPVWLEQRLATRDRHPSNIPKRFRMPCGRPLFCQA
jgi:hypothetical protein